MKNLGLVLAVLCVMIFINGCSVFLAARQPDKKDLSVCDIGTSRSLVLSEFGKPLYSSKDGDYNYDIFAFVQGYSRGTRTGRALFHGVADVFTLGLWETVGTPIEIAASGTKMRIKITYDKDNRVMKVENLKAPDKEKQIQQSGNEQQKNDASVVQRGSK
ncbi:MAG: hypothetical protein M0Z61_06505 [Nitrospiraceae bacterium]|nr:hypothetical protein [Nitrospiraceae bacterium]